MDEVFFTQGGFINSTHNHNFRDKFQVPLIGPIIPDVDVVIDKVLDVGAATDKPEQLMNYTLEEYFLGGEEWKAISQIKTGLSTKNSNGINARSVFLKFTLREDPVYQVQVGKVVGHSTVM
jgi:hypothetical protein